MEFLSILVSSLLALISPVGAVIDRTTAHIIQSQLQKSELLQVRIDNTPSYQILQGKVQRVRIAGRGLHLKQQNLRIAVAELETDTVDLNWRQLRQGKLQLQRPLNAGVRLIFHQEDINQALRSPLVTNQLLNLGIRQLRDSQKYNIVNPRIEFLNNRWRFQVELTQDAELLAITVESGLRVVAGSQIQLVAPVVLVNGEAVPQQIVSEIATNFSRRLDLRQQDRYGLQARILQLEITPKKLAIATFVRVEPSFLSIRS